MIYADVAKQVAEVTTRIDRNVNWNTQSFLTGLIEWPSRAMLSGATSVQVIIPDHVDFHIAEEVVGLFGYSLVIMPSNETGPATAMLSWT